MINRTELTIVVPCFNEITTIENVVRDWCAECKRLDIGYEFLIYDAASTDGTVEVLHRLSDENSAIKSIIEKGLPHGPACLRGYSEAEGEWVFQLDSDDEMRPASFESLWREREAYDLLLGVRQGRVSPLGRRLVTLGSRMAVAVLFGPGIRDVNTPYRLMRKEMLDDILMRVPPDTLAPNVLICGLARRSGARIFQIEVPHYAREEGTASGLVSWGLVKTAAKCGRQTVAAALRR